MPVPTTLLSRRGIAAVSVGVLALLTTGCVPGGSGDDASGGCGSTVLRVAAAPEIAEVVTEAAAALDSCTRVKVTPEDPATTAGQLSGSTGSTAYDVWIPDSSRWLSAVPSAATGTEPPSIASTPVVVAVATQLARRLGPQPTYDALAAAAGTTTTLAAADPKTSAVTQAALVDLGTALRSSPNLRGQLGAMLRALHVQPAGLAADAPVQVATEQQVRAANASAGSRVLVAVRPNESGRSLDFPYVVTSYDESRAAAADALLTQLTGPETRAELQRLGFRTGGGSTVHPLSAEDADAALASMATLARPTRLLAVVDVSGSMTRVVPGAGGTTRIELARVAMSEGMKLLPDHTVAALWRFSANLSPGADYEQVVPFTEITAQNRAQVAAATSGLKVKPNGGTGLYATTLAAVRAVRAGYDPTRVNSVMVLSDGRDEKAEAHHIDLAALLATLQAEDDPERPVIVNMIAYGPDSDAGAMQQVASATGGTVYAVRDPREIGEVFRDAIGSRLCDGAC